MVLRKRRRTASLASRHAVINVLICRSPAISSRVSPFA